MATSEYSFLRLNGPDTANVVAAGDQWEPAIVTTTGGASVVFFNSEGTINAQALNASGEPTGTNIIVSTASGALEPQAVRLSNGNVVVTWQQGDDDGAIQGRIYGPDMKPVTDVVNLAADNLNSYTQPEIVASTDGGFFVASSAAPNSVAAGISVKKYDASGVQVDTILYTKAGALDLDPSVTVLANGNVAVAWERQVGTATEVWYRIYSSNLDPVTDPTKLDATGSINRDVDVSARPDGSFTISYADNFAGGNTNVTTYLMNADGSPITYRVTGSTAGSNENVSVATSTEGYQVIVNEDRTTAGAWDVAGSILLPDGTVVAIDTVLQSGAGYQFAPSVTWVNSSTVQLAYSATESAVDGDGDDYGLAVSQFGVVHTQMGDDTAEVIRGDGLLDVINGFGGNDRLFGGAGRDSLSGGEGSDRLYGGRGADQHLGGDGPGVDYACYNDADYGDLVINLAKASVNTGAAAGDTYVGIEGVIGGLGDDVISGDAARNYLQGGAGRDLLDGRGGRDVLTGGLGERDDFRFKTALGADNIDRITDFEHGLDKFLLSQATFGAIGSKLGADEFGGSADPNNFIVYKQDTGRLFYDADGAGGAAPVLFATVSAGTVLDASDFLMIA